PVPPVPPCRSDARATRAVDGRGRDHQQRRILAPDRPWVPSRRDAPQLPVDAMIDPSVALLAVVALWAYLRGRSALPERRIASFASGVVVVVVALSPWLERLAAQRLSVHMV